MKTFPVFLPLLLLACGEDPPILSNAEVISRTQFCEAAGLNAEIDRWARRGEVIGIAAVHCVPRKHCKPHY